MDEMHSGLPFNGETQIRLLKIDQEKQDGIFCELIIADLEKRPPYIALSYTWGPATHEEAERGVTSDRVLPVICNGHEVLVTNNLHSFLKRATKSPLFQTKYLWIDMLCIDQSNRMERTSQVRLMSTIYHSAQVVLIWLGEEDEHTKRSFQLIEHLSNCSEKNLDKIIPRRIGSEEVLEILKPHGDISYWTSVKELFTRTYFTRVWIIQEVMLAQNLLALCGSHSIDWKHLVKVSSFLTVTSWTRWLCTTDNTSAKRCHHAIPNLLRANKDTKIEGDKNTMLYSLIRSRRFRASDQRDKVYALLGIGGDFVLGKPRFNPVYGTRTVQTTFTLTAIQILEDSEDLLLLAQAEGDAFKKIPLLPSWVPDWSCNEVLGLGVTGYKRFSAAGTLPRELIIHESSETLTVKGFELDRIVSIGECKHQVLAGEAFPKWVSLFRELPIIYHTGEHRFEIFWRTMITNTGGPPIVYPAPASYRPAFKSWILAKFEANVDKKFRQQAETFISPNDSLVPDMLNNNIDAEEYETVFSHSQMLRPFVTDQKYLGSGSQSLTEGDSVWIVAGSRVPLILRKADSNSYKIVGGAYVHGFMNGEALKLGRPFRDITIL